MYKRHLKKTREGERARMGADTRHVGTYLFVGFGILFVSGSLNKDPY